eukprot:869135-Prorocentrum_lima.AAC.1
MLQDIELNIGHVVDANSNTILGALKTLHKKKSNILMRLDIAQSTPATTRSSTPRIATFAR